MKAIYVYEHGSPEVLKIREIPVPDLQSDEILVKNSCIGINYVDIQHRAGVNYPIQLPFIPGIEAVGTVSEKGSKVIKFKKGDRVGFAGYMGEIMLSIPLFLRKN